MPFSWPEGFDKLSLTAKAECQAELVEAFLKQKQRLRKIS